MVCHAHPTVLITLLHGYDTSTTGAMVIIGGGGRGIIATIHCVETGSPVLSERENEDCSPAKQFGFNFSYKVCIEVRMCSL